MNILNRFKSLTFILTVLFTVQLSNATYTQPLNGNDSLKRIVDDIKTNDTLRALVLCDLGANFKDLSPAKADNYLKRAYEISRKINFLHAKGLSLTRLGILNYDQGRIKEALEYWFTSIDVYRKLLNSTKKYHQKLGNEGILDNLNWVARVYCNIGEMENFEKHLKEIKKILSNSNVEFSRVAWLTIEWAGCYYSNGKYDESMRQFQTAFDYFKKAGDEYGMANTLANLGMVNLELEKYDTAITYLRRSLVKYSAMNNGDGKTWVNNILGNAYGKMKEFDSAFIYYQQAYIEAKSVNRFENIISSRINIGRLMANFNRVEESIPYWTEAFELAKQYNIPEFIITTSSHLADYYDKKKKPDDALYYFKFYMKTKDSLNNSENMKSIGQMEAKYDFDNARDNQKIKHKQELEKQELEAESEKARQRWIIFTVIIVLTLVIIFSGFLYKRILITRKQNRLIEKQKHLVEEKNKEILDSINYAKRIQAAVLPSDKIIKNQLPDSFILYQPKDIVAGDFYWMEIKNNKTMIAACDCTGHGVPGAMVSVICNNGLNRSVRELGITNPGKILDKTREIVVQEFEKSDTNVNDGMDLALVSIEKNGENFTVEFAGANNPIWFYDHTQSKLNEIKGTKQHIGKYENPRPFDSHSFNLKKNDIIYLFTDGYKDQFGYDKLRKNGKKGEKFKTKRLRKLLLANIAEPLQKQKEILLQTHEEWKADLEQIDDICIIGIRL